MVYLAHNFISDEAVRTLAVEGTLENLIYECRRCKVG